jgi:hypothetical protein
MRKYLLNLVDVLERNGERTLAAKVSDALVGSDADVDAFLVSNDLWGGSGSIADQGGTGAVRRAGRRAIEAVLIELGDEQLRVGKVNPRTAMWVEAFKQWSHRGI